MNQNLFYGELVRLCAVDPENFVDEANRWERNSEYCRLLSGSYVRLRSKKNIKELIKKEQAQKTLTFIDFEIRTLQDDCLIGNLGIEIDDWRHGDAFVSVGLGEHTYWGRGYGTDAMRVLLRYAFSELNLYRVSLNVFEYNPRAIRSYEKAGFTCEGHTKQQLKRDGRRWDLIFMGILREEWQRRKTEADELVKENK